MRQDDFPIAEIQHSITPTLHHSTGIRINISDFKLLTHRRRYET
jgi:hypothetical protein